MIATLPLAIAALPILLQWRQRTRARLP